MTVLCLVGIATAATAAPPQPDFARDVTPVLSQFCVKCHNQKKSNGDVAFDGFANETLARKERELWERVLENVKGGLMPPPDKPRPNPEQTERLIAWIEQSLAASAPPTKIDPGRVTLRRLNRAEFNNTIRDLIGLDLRPADVFPSDDVGYGFDNIGDVLSMPPLLVEKYLTAAEQTVEAALKIPPPPPSGPEVRRFQGRELRSTTQTPQQRRGVQWRLLTTNGELRAMYNFPAAANYIFRVRAFGHQAGKEPVKMAFLVDDREFARVDVTAPEKSPKVYTVQTKVASTGVKRVALAFVNDYHEPNAADPNRRDRNLGVHHLEIEGPVGLPPAPPPAPPEAYRRIMIAEPTPGRETQAASKILRNFAKRAFRRPVSPAEVDRLVALFESAHTNGVGFERALKAPLQAVLVSPHFLFRVEPDRKTDDPDGVRPVSDFELASRLSYFLWSSMPDDALFRLADRGELHDPVVLTAQVKRMLADPRAQSLPENFAGQWLQTRNLNSVQPATDKFPTFDEALRTAMQKETELFVGAMIAENRDIIDFLDADFTYANDRLAKHYGLRGAFSAAFQRVSLPKDGPLGGVITHASVMTVTANPTRTSPVKRGKWILENIFGTPPPPPPPGAGDLPDDNHGPLKGTLRQRMEQHRGNLTCASCHQRMDPLGFGLENFDGIGAWRTKDGSRPIDASGVLPGGVSFNGPAELKRVLKAKRDLFRRCLVEKLLTYAIGRGLEKPDRHAVERICRAVAEQGDKMQSVFVEIATSDPFLKRKNRKAD